MTDSVAVSLQALLLEVAPDVVSSVYVPTPAALDSLVRTIAFHDSANPEDLQPDSLILGVGTQPPHPATAQLVLDAGAKRVAAIALKSDTTRAFDDLCRVAEQASIVLLRVQPATDWGELYATLRAQVAVSSLGIDGEVAASDLYSLADSLASSTAGAVVITDSCWQVVGYSRHSSAVDEFWLRAIAGRRLPPQQLDDGDGHGRRANPLSPAGAPIYFPQQGSTPPRLAALVKIDGVILGSVWIVQGQEELGEKAQTVLRSSLHVIATHLLRWKTSGGDVEGRRRARLVHALLEGESQDLASAGLGLSNGPFAVLAFEAFGWRFSNVESPEVLGKRILHIIEASPAGMSVPPVCVAIDGVTYAIVSMAQRNDGANEQQLSTFANHIIRLARERYELAVNCGVGTPFPLLSGARRSREEADIVLRVLDDREKAGHLAHYTSMSTIAHLYRLRESGQLPLDSRLATLIAHDAEHGSSHVATLAAYFRHFGNVREGAAETHVHPNTFRYRMERAIEICGLDLNDESERLALWLALWSLRRQTAEVGTQVFGSPPPMIAQVATE